MKAATRKGLPYDRNGNPQGVAQRPDTLFS